MAESIAGGLILGRPQAPIITIITVITMVARKPPVIACLILYCI